MNSLTVLDEPLLEFASGGRLEHPRDGLTLFGPADSKRNAAQSSKPRYGVIGTKNGVAAFNEFTAALAHPILTDDYLDEILWPHFPGYNEAFHAVLPDEPAWVEELDVLELKDAATDHDDHKRVFGVVSLFLERIRTAKKFLKEFDYFVVVVPDFVFTTCRPTSRFQGGHGQRLSKREQRLRALMLDFFETYNPEQYWWSLDFRYQMKARAMALEAPVQIIRESTLRLAKAERRVGGRQLTPLSDRAWNLSTALYYKSGGIPWKLSDPREDVCHIGISFKETDSANIVLSAAQVFGGDGDGIVVSGDDGNWSRGKIGDYHLSTESAQHLLSHALQTWKTLRRPKPKEIFLHCRSRPDEDEIAGYQAACPAGVKLVVVRVAPEHTGLRLFRAGTQPLLRGTLWEVSPRRGFLWGSGFKPRLRAYDGLGVPQPLCLDIVYGEADLTHVAKDILSLTKLNYNGCRLGENQPVTTHFSNLIGEILGSNRQFRNHQSQLKYYI